MPLPDALFNALAYVSRICGFDTVDSFPPGHQYARTRWNRAYFDIASDLKPEQIDRSLSESISNTPLIFAHITHPTPRMQRALLAVIEARMRRSSGDPFDLATLLVDAYRSPHTPEAMPGLRAAIERTEGDTPAQRAYAVLNFLGAMPAAFDVIEAARQAAPAHGGSTAGSGRAAP
jgi:hypothetical protein